MAESIDPVTMKRMAKELLQRFFFLQDRIVETYRLFDEGFGVYLDTNPTHLYRQLVDAISDNFEKISCELIYIKTELFYSHNQKELATLVEKILYKQKIKLDLIMDLKVAERELHNHQGEESLVNKVRELKERMKGLQEEINEVLEEIKYESEDLYEDDQVER
ncbi:hypothetical protein CHS0354_026467 [Potamilus streckersoni]|uniref:Uncharacterized protein n=1 Tax=Potamilus streckersoni TaxID=2493646 RepID=A0AAE0RQL7_9BIVA|nr:hypothetical protein CHS0354_026467 [Potamilus streckersoni]